jgi:hypothetical protein
LRFCVTDNFNAGRINVQNKLGVLPINILTQPKRLTKSHSIIHLSVVKNNAKCDSYECNDLVTLKRPRKHTCEHASTLCKSAFSI